MLSGRLACLSRQLALDLGQFLPDDLGQFLPDRGLGRPPSWISWSLARPVTSARVPEASKSSRAFARCPQPGRRVFGAAGGLVHGVITPADS